MSTHPDAPTHNRRTVLRTAAWATPVIAVAIATPLAAASAVPNDEADFRWAQESQGTYGDLVADSDDLGGTYSIQYSFNGTSLPQDALIAITVTFSGDAIDLRSVPSGWEVSPESGAGNTLTFTKPVGWGQALTFNFTTTNASQQVASATMTIINGGEATWTDVTDTVAATV